MTTTTSAPALPLDELRRMFHLPQNWQPVREELRATTPAACSRCDRMVRLPFGPGEALCRVCRSAQAVDMRWTAAVTP